ncbi:hypothetical protein NT2_10_00360 [Caenibius tardaugens NBRC 16725]|uniref:Uncharacterized protein n=1 Tax=Caenibius tardaugens NBRC 16725 TaxID=1219035 RepID=U2YAX5_9SPHN|nr:hypothetical protein NT2_10_00360 [Caenibius tardaugens NBRC 16725]
MHRHWVKDCLDGANSPGSSKSGGAGRLTLGEQTLIGMQGKALLALTAALDNPLTPERKEFAGLLTMFSTVIRLLQRLLVAMPLLCAPVRTSLGGTCARR